MSLLDIGTELRHERYFDSHPRVGGDGDQDAIARSEGISIRTPAWGGPDLAVKEASEAISIRTPAWGVTGEKGETGATGAFQFAPPRGG